MKSSFGYAISSDSSKFRVIDKRETISFEIEDINAEAFETLSKWVQSIFVVNTYDDYFIPLGY